MAKVLNKTDRSLPVERWTLFAGGTKCVDQNGRIRDELPDSVAYGPVVQHLLSLDLVSLGGVPKKTAKAVSVSGEVQEIDLTPKNTVLDVTAGLTKSQRKKLRADQRG